MPNQLFEMLENRSLLSVTLLTGAPADAAHERQVIVETAAAEADGAGSDDDMYRFTPGADDAVYETEEDDGSGYAVLAGDIGTFDSGWDGADADEIVHPWINFSDAPGDVDSSALAQAVQAAHKPTAILPDKDRGDDRSGKTTSPVGKSDLTKITFDFGSGVAMPTYTGEAL